MNQLPGVPGCSGSQNFETSGKIPTGRHQFKGGTGNQSSQHFERNNSTIIKNAVSSQTSESSASHIGNVGPLLKSSPTQKNNKEIPGLLDYHVENNLLRIFY